MGTGVDQSGGGPPAGPGSTRYPAFPGLDPGISSAGHVAPLEGDRRPGAGDPRHTHPVRGVEGARYASGGEDDRLERESAVSTVLEFPNSRQERKGQEKTRPPGRRRVPGAGPPRHAPRPLSATSCDVGHVAGGQRLTSPPLHHRRDRADSCRGVITAGGQWGTGVDHSAAVPHAPTPVQPATSVPCARSSGYIGGPTFAARGRRGPGGEIRTHPGPCSAGPATFRLVAGNLRLSTRRRDCRRPAPSRSSPAACNLSRRCFWPACSVLQRAARTRCRVPPCSRTVSNGGGFTVRRGTSVQDAPPDRTETNWARRSGWVPAGSIPPASSTSRGPHSSRSGHDEVEARLTAATSLACAQRRTT